MPSAVSSAPACSEYLGTDDEAMDEEELANLLKLEAVPAA
jgi:hypothetical protein